MKVSEKISSVHRISMYAKKIYSYFARNFAMLLRSVPIFIKVCSKQFETLNSNFLEQVAKFRLSFDKLQFHFFRIK